MRGFLPRWTTPVPRLALLACLALASSFALGGCTAGDPEPSITLDAPTVTALVPKPAILQKSIECPASPEDFPRNADTNYPAEPRGSVPADFVVEKVFLCRPDMTEIDGTAKLIAHQEELQGDFAPLLAALAVPSERADAGQLVCPAILETIPVLWLVNASGEAVDVALPTTECRQASGKPDTQKAIDALKIIDVEVFPVPEQYFPDPAALQSAVACSLPAGGNNMPTGTAAEMKGRVPDGFVPTEVIRCTPDLAAATVHDDQLSGDLTPLLEALAMPSERGGARSCLDYADVPPELWLVNAQGQTINVTWPLDNCEHLNPATALALNALTITTTTPVPATPTAKVSTP
ncbi:hypothetical protein [Arthrobacter psychrolactophilus]